MIKNRKKHLAILLAAVTTFTMSAVPAFADRVDKTYLALGADLNEQDKNKVLELLDVKKSNLDDYDVVTVTNADEHKYLDSYLDASVIGSRALSSVKVEQKSSGNGLKVTTKNITYCTKVMYQNALATAGVKDADIVVAGPFNISGTAALVGAMKAYSELTGKELDSDKVDTATDELVTTSKIADEIGDQDKAEELVGAVKDAVVSENIKDPAKIEDTIKDTATKLEISLTEEQIQMIRDLMEKLSKLDLDINSLKEQAKGLYDKLSDLDVNLGISKEEANGFFAKIANWFSQLWDKIQSAFQ
ncbi:DUF1002 domain-containing protein [Blautia liquoris]|jgi:uncharacterized protein YpuA (DUF1002 family)|uniref:DUF1002 domain-containing protein n=1 Tax=Blautia liquoris TaxID=2779518 RepID=A0A7M2RG77_9FIRM|nr:DUF1002 domain-containing protein [Blautia liquoris]QOV19346.1 DUF1002 domain-containing protein [Blautia liquoris]